MSSLYDSAAAYQTKNQQAAESPQPIEAVLFDFSNTLFRMVDVDVWLNRVMRAADRTPLDDEELTDGAAQLTKAYELPQVIAAQQGRDLSPERHRNAMDAWFGKTELLKGIEAIAYEQLHAPDAWVPYDDTERVLRALHERSIKIGIVSDFAWDLRVHLDHYGLGTLVDAVVLSCEIGREKPAPEMFHTACEQLDANPRATLMVGDNPTRDGGAAACGLRAYVLPGGHHNADRGLDHVLGFLP